MCTAVRGSFRPPTVATQARAAGCRQVRCIGTTRATQALGAQGLATCAQQKTNETTGDFMTINEGTPELSPLEIPTQARACFSFPKRGKKGSGQKTSMETTFSKAESSALPTVASANLRAPMNSF